MNSSAALPVFGHFIQVGDKEGNQTNPALKELPVGCWDRHLSQELQREQASEPALGAREGVTEEEFSGDLFGTG